MMNEQFTLYLETTIPSFLTARPSNNLIVAGKQETTRQWWERRRSRYQLFISQYVLDEISGGDSEAAKRRLEAVQTVDLLEVDEETIRLAARLMRTGLIPVKAAADAAHIAVAARHRMDFLLTWNCTHIANAELLRALSAAAAEADHTLPVICTPDELFGGDDE
jgi:predicted nucleic acid-binding protein